MQQPNDLSVNSLASFRNSWNFNRALTIDLLNSLSDSDLLLSPGSGVGQFWKQFRHIGRVQEDYMNALETKTVVFTCENKKYNQGPNRVALVDYLKQLDESLFQKLEKIDPDTVIDWYGEKVNISEHLSRLADHEVLHHGQLIVYCQLLDRKFPESWSAWGL